MGEVGEVGEVGESIGEIARKYLNTSKENRDKTFGIRKIDNHHYIGNTHVIVKDNDIIIANNGETFKGTPGLWSLIMEKIVGDYLKEDYDNYTRLMIKTNALHRENNPDNPHPKANPGPKWVSILRPIWFNNKKTKGKGIIIIPEDPNVLLERLDLLLA